MPTSCAAVSAQGDLHRVGRFLAAQGACQVVLDFLLRVSLVLIAELDTDTGRSFSLGTFRCHPDNRASYGNLFFLAHEVEQHEHLIAESVRAIGRDEQATVDDIGHVREVQRALVFDRECQ